MFTGLLRVVSLNLVFVTFLKEKKAFFLYVNEVQPFMQRYKWVSLFFCYVENVYNKLFVFLFPIKKTQFSEKLKS